MTVEKRPISARAQGARHRAWQADQIRLKLFIAQDEANRAGFVDLASRIRRVIDDAANQRDEFHRQARKYYGIEGTKP